MASAHGICSECGSQTEYRTNMRAEGSRVPLPDESEKARKPFRWRPAVITHLLEALFGCKHEFGFPIRTERSDTAYQVCRKCGKEYEYDWGLMRRGEPVKRTAAGAQPYNSKAA